MHFLVSVLRTVQRLLLAGMDTLVRPEPLQIRDVPTPEQMAEMQSVAYTRAAVKNAPTHLRIVMAITKLIWQTVLLNSFFVQALRVFLGG